MWPAGARLRSEAPRSLLSPDAKLTSHSRHLRGAGGGEGGVGERRCLGNGEGLSGGFLLLGLRYHARDGRV